MGNKHKFKIKKIIYIISFLIISISLPEISVQASESQVDEEAGKMDTSLLDELDFTDIDTSLKEALAKEPFSFKEAVLKLITGEIPLTMENVGSVIWDGLFASLNEQKDTLIQVLLIIIVSSVINNFANVFENGQVSEISFYIVYLLLFTILIRAFTSLTSLVSQGLTAVVEFMRALVPAYFMTVAVASGSTSAIVFYQVTLIIIMLVQWIFLYVVMPAVNAYVILSLVNRLSKEAFLTKLTKLLKDAVEWILKTMMAAVLGINVIQGLIMPMVDAVKSTILNKSVSAIPGIGNVFNSVTEIVLGSAVLIKNSVGVAALIVILLICGIPLLKLGISSFLYRFLGAIVQPITDSRAAGCIEDIGEGAKLLFKTLSSTVILFLITIAMITAATNRGY